MKGTDYDMDSIEVLEEMQSILNKWLGKEEPDATLITVSSSEEVQNIEVVVMRVIEAIITNTPIDNITNHPGLNKFIQHQVNCVIE